ncbi:pyrroline-5-carboxylate reductase [Gordoniibacillus kamchatkensis]|uniref:Pyrroline-5-carboxylate reductase n=1 Tax=Gordoniibacillus kamchatkensis TaxID=1590651 RepID=A0ABR5AG76_9BACL|nr:pyrroline-5-carboxylate reductase [Paenibacillus sp. VKM B-2647]KIL40044.1 pyrroline-5-carboxylate reductase [Paenibacillus sp. VKM B-2647]
MASSLHSFRIAFVGAGSMAEAIIRGLTETGVADPGRIAVVNRSDSGRLEQLHARYGIRTSNDANTKYDMIAEADIVVMAMKPKDVEATFRDLKHAISSKQLLVSVIAGLSIAKIAALLETSAPIVRTMPNTSSTIGLGATGMAFSANVSPEQKELALGIFEAVGIVSVVAEPLLDIVTGVSGSGPAYIYYFMEAMTKAAVEGGLSAEEAQRLTLQTVLGAARMVELTQEHPAELRRKVTSPNGTTQAAIETLDRHQFSEGIVRAVFRAAERAKEMGEAIAPDSVLR